MLFSRRGEIMVSDGDNDLIQVGRVEIEAADEPTSALSITKKPKWNQKLWQFLKKAANATLRFIREHWFALLLAISAIALIIAVPLMIYLWPVIIPALATLSIFASIGLAVMPIIEATIVVTVAAVLSLFIAAAVFQLQVIIRDIIHSWLHSEEQDSTAPLLRDAQQLAEPEKLSRLQKVGKFLGHNWYLTAMSVLVVGLAIAIPAATFIWPVAIPAAAAAFTIGALAPLAFIAGLTVPQVAFSLAGIAVGIAIVSSVLNYLAVKSYVVIDNKMKIKDEEPVNPNRANARSVERRHPLRRLINNTTEPQHTGPMNTTRQPVRDNFAASGRLRVQNHQTVENFIGGGPDLDDGESGTLQITSAGGVGRLQ